MFARIPHAAVHALAGRARRIGGVLPHIVGRRRWALVPAALGLAVVTIGALAVGAASTPTHATATGATAGAAARYSDGRPAAAARAGRAARTRPTDPKTAAKKAAVTKTVAKKAARKSPAWVAPMARFTLSSCYGRRWGAMHEGLDFAMPAGTPIRAVGAGTVSAAGWTYAGYGISVVIDHGHGYLTHYAHVSRVFVRPGQKVRAGQVIALEGSTGHSTGPHLHFEVHRGMWRQFNPAPWLRSHDVKIGC